ncbi:MAG: branched-chain alpha-keto acid dehydrogenase subunit E2 [Coxiella sp. RIFCSPHIGHO2_12_FULL_42_15]|nr:MAG: branched-chain alpha-keto acid dehydrogenase subunit E2 [Coxiella sp. RIFCSPHIGHO2_12_FULL_42_15]
MKLFNLPDLGEGLPDAIIREWYVKVGDEINTDQPMVAMETAKALVDVPAPFNGKVEKLFGNPGDTMDTGQPLIGFEGADDASQQQDKGTVVGSIETSGTIQEMTSRALTGSPSTGSTVKATPAVRMLAKQLNVDLNQITPQGSHITVEEVKQAAKIAAPAMTPAPMLNGEVTPLSGVRRAMALSMARAHQEIASASIMDDADLSAWDNQQDITLRLLRAMAAACKAVPMLNYFYDGQRMAYQENKNINIGIAVDTPHGLYVPVLKDVGNRSDQALREDINRFKKQAQDRSIPASDLQGATILMSNVGAIAGNYAAPIVTPPLVAIVAFGRIKNTVVADKKGEIAVHPMISISITFDHRPVTGGDAARFLKALTTELEKSTLT